MISMKGAILSALIDFVARTTGIQPELKPSKRAHLASNSFLRADAQATATALHADRVNCRLFGAPLLASVSAENGWLLFFFTADAIDAYAETLPQPEEPDGSYLNRRLWSMARRPDAPAPDDPYLLDGFYALLFNAPNGEERFLSAPRHYDGDARVALEQRRTCMANILLSERRNRT